ncbi:hypothetical protein ABIC83_002483 [Roseateles asaccharophilus]|uniref:hypothetical protein n=1 Tax=Roseateles asaccharophilus TaxID=582607 RepID=UPI0038371064
MDIDTTIKSSEVAVTTALDGVRMVAAALAAHTRAVLEAATLSPQVGLLDSSLLVAAAGQGPIAEAASEFIAARSKLTAALRAKRDEAQAAANKIVWPLLSELLGAQMPGVVTLSVDGGFQSITERVVGLESISERNGVVSGLVNTSSADGRSRSTRWFVVRDGKPFFEEDGIL